MSETTVKETSVEEVVEDVNVTETEATKESKEKAKKDNKQKAKKKNWFKGLKAEFKKIIWPDRKTLVKQIVAVIVCSLILGGIIAIIDSLIKYGLELLV